ncbi:MAG: hypothetical protein IGBAC_2022 [Ignavibacteriae bacterium]|nr:MAG: hypothetical protein IGBAC_2022 [Ignavibacteriota bacterium]
MQRLKFIKNYFIFREKLIWKTKNLFMIPLKHFQVYIG